MAPLTTNQVVQLDGAYYSVVDVLSATYRSGRPGDRWFVLQSSDGPVCLVRERENALVLLAPDGVSPPSGGALDKVRFASTTGAWPQRGIFAYAELARGACVRIGEQSYRLSAVELGDDDSLHRIEPRSVPARVVDLAALGIAPFLGIVSLFVTRFSFTSVLLGLGGIAVLLRRVDRTLTATYHSLAAAMAAFLALSPFTILAGLWGVHQDIVATVLVIASVPIAVHYPIARQTLAAAALSSAVAAALPFLALALWCLIDEDGSWWSDWPRWYRYGSLLVPLVYVIALSRGGRKWLRETAESVRSE